MCELCNADAITYRIPIVRSKEYGTWWLVQATKNGWDMKKGQFGITKKNDPILFFWKDSLDNWVNFADGLELSSQYSLVMDNLSDLTQACKTTYKYNEVTEKWLFNKIKEIILEGTIYENDWRVEEVEGGFYEAREWIKSKINSKWVKTNNIIIGRDKSWVENIIKERLGF